jgi:hypothetical protein
LKLPGIIRSYLSLATIAALSFAAGCASSARVNSSPGPSQEVPPNRSFDQLTPGTTTHRKLSACINEYQGFLFAIRPAKSMDKVKLAATPPQFIDTGSILVELARVRPVHIDRFPGWHVRSIPPSLREHDPLDVLVPLNAPKGGMPSRLEAGKEYIFWAEMIAAKGTVAGLYDIPITLESAGKSVGMLNVQFAVWPMVLPDEGNVAAIGEVDHTGLFRHHLSGAAANAPSATTWHDQPRSREYDELLSRTLQLLQSHRIAPILSDLGPTVKVSARGELDVDWTNYDHAVAPLMSGSAFANRMPLPAWPLPVKDLLRYSESTTIGAAGSQVLAKGYVRECAKHFQEKGWLERAFAILEPAGGASAGFNAGVELFGDAHPEIQIASRGFPQNMNLYGWFDFKKIIPGDVSIWITDAQFHDPAAMKRERDMGRRTWLAADRPPFSGSTALHARPADTLVLSWQADLLDAEFLWLGCVNCWPADPAQFDPATCAKFDPSALIFPGTAFGLADPVSTLRLKRVRETMQYAAYSKLLAQHGREHIAETLRTSLAGYAGTQAYRTHFFDGRSNGWPDSDQFFEKARQIMGQEMLGLSVATTPPAEETNIGSDLFLREFMTSTRGIRTRLDGARVRMTGTSTSGKVEMETWCTVSNQSRTPVRATASLLGLPASCAAQQKPTQIDLESGKSQRVGLSLICDPEWLQIARTNDLAIRIAELDQPPIHTPVRMSFLVAEPTSHPLVIDGELSDWAAAASNVASDFQLIAGECDNGEEGCARPTLRTFAFTRRDANFLYIAINAEARPGPEPGSRRKSVNYDDLILMDEEDLVEILIDPLNGVTRSPADLYHIVVKRSGVSLNERGISTAPPVGQRRSWQADIDVASRAQSNRWTAEVRIPLSSFGRPGTVRGEIWGFNVTHYNASQQEFSTWSGAVGNAYDPLSLGNLWLP